MAGGGKAVKLKHHVMLKFLSNDGPFLFRNGYAGVWNRNESFSNLGVTFISLPVVDRLWRHPQHRCHVRLCHALTAAFGPTSIDRVSALLGKLDSVKASQERGSEVKKEAKRLFNKFIEQLEPVFSGLPRATDWQSFYRNDLPLATKLDGGRK
jgi:hypothetical protein